MKVSGNTASQPILSVYDQVDRMTIRPEANAAEIAFAEAELAAEARGARADREKEVAG